VQNFKMQFKLTSR